MTIDWTKPIETVYNQPAKFIGRNEKGVALIEIGDVLLHCSEEGLTRPTIGSAPRGRLRNE